MHLLAVGGEARLHLCAIGSRARRLVALPEDAVRVAALLQVLHLLRRTLLLAPRQRLSPALAGAPRGCRGVLSGATPINTAGLPPMLAQMVVPMLNTSAPMARPEPSRCLMCPLFHQGAVTTLRELDALPRKDAPAAEINATVLSFWLNAAPLNAARGE